MIRAGPGDHQGHHFRVERRPSRADAPEVLSKCSYSVTPFTNDAIGGVEPRFGAPDGVFVYFQDSTQTLVDTEFYLTVTC
jgi:hypothetical protein